jgi:hypothetical protein
MVHSFARPARAFWMALLVFGRAVAAFSPVTAAEADAVSFNRDIRPILSDNCFYCHGPDASHRQADLRLDLREEAVAAKAIVPGKPAESSIVARINSTDPEELMPPPESHKKLDAKQKALLTRWIEQGAEYQKHWAYEPPVKAAVPAGAKAIDHLVRQRLTKLGLEPAPEADRRTLIRRLSFDLTGLPPTPAEVEAFVADPSPDAYEKLVERMLASPHYGERMAIGWLDVVRFADTIGYHSDNPRNVWPYRDWVRGAPSPRTTRRGCSPIGCGPWARCGSARPPAARAATTTSSIRSRCGIFTRSGRSSPTSKSGRSANARTAWWWRRPRI